MLRPGLSGYARTQKTTAHAALYPFAQLHRQADLTAVTLNIQDNRFAGTLLELALACDRTYQLALPGDAARVFRRKPVQPAAGENISPDNVTREIRRENVNDDQEQANEILALIDGYRK